MANKTQTGGHADGHGHISRRTYWTIFALLMALMGATVGAYIIEQRIELPAILGISIAVGIAMIKTTLIVIFFMHVKLASKLVQLFAAAGFVWLLILFFITMGDYLARDWPPPLVGPLS